MRRRRLAARVAELCDVLRLKGDNRDVTESLLNNWRVAQIVARGACGHGLSLDTIWADLADEQIHQPCNVPGAAVLIAPRGIGSNGGDVIGTEVGPRLTRTASTVLPPVEIQARRKRFAWVIVQPSSAHASGFPRR